MTNKPLDLIATSIDNSGNGWYVAGLTKEGWALWWLTQDLQWESDISRYPNMYYKSQRAAEEALEKSQSPNSSKKEAPIMITKEHRTIFRRAIVDLPLLDSERSKILTLLEKLVENKSEPNLLPALRKIVIGVPLDSGNKTMLLVTLEAIAATPESDISIGGRTVSQSLYDTCKAYCDRGHRIHAIKALREATNLGLKEAKDAIDQEWPPRFR